MFPVVTPACAANCAKPFDAPISRSTVMAPCAELMLTLPSAPTLPPTVRPDTVRLRTCTLSRAVTLTSARPALVAAAASIPVTVTPPEAALIERLPPLARTLDAVTPSRPTRLTVPPAITSPATQSAPERVPTHSEPAVELSETLPDKVPIAPVLTARLLAADNERLRVADKTPVVSAPSLAVSVRSRAALMLPASMLRALALTSPSVAVTVPGLDCALCVPMRTFPN